MIHDWGVASFTETEIKLLWYEEKVTYLFY